MYDDLNAQLAAEREKAHEYRREWESACERANGSHALYDAEREKSAGLARQLTAGRIEANADLKQGFSDALCRAHAERDTALAAQKAAEERAGKTDKALVRAHCDLRWYEGYSGKGSVALAENSAVGFSVAWEKAVVLAPQAPAAEPEGSGK
jgi:hypothetical protein